MFHFQPTSSTSSELDIVLIGSLVAQNTQYKLHHSRLEMTPMHDLLGDEDEDGVDAVTVAATEVDLHCPLPSLKRLRSASPHNDEHFSPARRHSSTGNTTSDRGGCGGCGGFGTAGNSNATRQILLLDLDCFYAQAMCRRYGWDAQTTPLALLQWNSVLAVTYPARQAYGIKRGDSWETVHEKSRGQCHAVHVPILTTTSAEATAATAANATAANTATAVNATAGNNVKDGTSNNEKSSVPLSLEQEYERFYCLSEAQQQEARRCELGVRKRSADGKASIECFRIASARILAAVRQWILDNDSSIVLERASIDEFFLDVTKAIQKNTSSLELRDSRSHTVVIGETESKEDLSIAMEREGESGCCGTWNHNLLPVDQSDNDEIHRLRRGCDIANRIRQVVYQQLGFTMSAGIGTNKTLAKLAVTYGKPAGQAVCFPRAVEYMLDHTPIRSCRNLGGKLGSAVAKLLPTNVPPMVGSIARHLSLLTLQHALADQATAQRVFDLARGVDREPVEAKTESSSAVLTKSITAFKSLNFAPPNTHRDVMGHTLTEAMPWIQLLSREVVTRIERDYSRNDRYPRNCSVHYAVYPASSHQDKSIRIPFPASRLTTEQKVAELVAAVPLALRSKIRSLGNDSRDTRPTAAADTVRLHRIGLCATNFESRAAGSNNAIGNYFSAAAASKDAGSMADSKAKVLIAGSVKTPRTILDEVTPPPSGTANLAVVDADLEYAKQLQATFDREHRVLEVLDKSSKTKSVNRNGRHPNNHGIDRFFLKR
jgi:nucleotidyltransferase/DNA polymerase involved in DNA repair